MKSWFSRLIGKKMKIQEKHDFVWSSEGKLRCDRNVILSDHRKKSEDAGKAWSLVIIGNKMKNDIGISKNDLETTNWSE